MEHLDDVLLVVCILMSDMRTSSAVFSSSARDSMACLPGPRILDHDIAGSSKVCVMAAKLGVPQRVSCPPDVSQEELAVQCSSSRCSSTRGSWKQQWCTQQNHRHRAALRSRAIVSGGVLPCMLDHQTNKTLHCKIFVCFKGVGAVSSMRCLTLVDL